MLTPDDYDHAGQRSTHSIPPEPQGEAQSQVGAAADRGVFGDRYRAEFVGGPECGSIVRLPRGIEGYFYFSLRTMCTHRYRAMRDRDGVWLIYCGVVT